MRPKMGCRRKRPMMTVPKMVWVVLKSCVLVNYSISKYMEGEAGWRWTM
jgi:hypothetical protein